MRKSHYRAIAAALCCVTGAASFAACGTTGPDDLFPTGGGKGPGPGDGGGGAGGEGATTTSSTSGGGSAPDAGSFTCEECSGATPVCVDGEECAAACPVARAACGTAGADGPQTCCEEGAHCCAASVFGYNGADLCVAANELCPLGCPGGDTVCPGDQYCELDPATNAYSCTTECAPERTCDQNLCCPFGTSCKNGVCELPDITVDDQWLINSVDLTTRTFESGACEIFEGCIATPGRRRLLRFDLRTPNIGAGDLFLGVPDGNPLFEFSMCHGHYHFNGYANYRLLDDAGNEVGSGHKQAFCLLDLDRNDPSAPLAGHYDCGNQGIQAGWADIYNRDLPCQWVDVTDVPPGNYLLKIELNVGHVLAESDYTNNAVTVPVTITESGDGP